MGSGVGKLGKLLRQNIPCNVNGRLPGNNWIRCGTFEKSDAQRGKPLSCLLEAFFSGLFVNSAFCR